MRDFNGTCWNEWNKVSFSLDISSTIPTSDTNNSPALDCPSKAHLTSPKERGAGGKEPLPFIQVSCEEGSENAVVFQHGQNRLFRKINSACDSSSYNTNHGHNPVKHFSTCLTGNLWAAPLIARNQLSCLKLNMRSGSWQVGAEQGHCPGALPYYLWLYGFSFGLDLGLLEQGSRISRRAKREQSQGVPAVLSTTLLLWQNV